MKLHVDPEKSHVIRDEGGAVVAVLVDYPLMREAIGKVFVDAWNNAGELERENAEVKTALEGIMPFVEEDYMPDYATPAFKAAVEKSRAALGQKEG